MLVGGKESDHHTFGANSHAGVTALSSAQKESFSKTTHHQNHLKKGKGMMMIGADVVPTTTAARSNRSLGVSSSNHHHQPPNILSTKGRGADQAVVMDSGQPISLNIGPAAGVVGGVPPLNMEIVQKKTER